jgi:hypothetical protein
MTAKKVIQWYKQMNFPLFENNSKDLNFNLFVYRALDDGSDMPNDIAGLLWKDLTGEWQLYTFTVTADPGIDGLLTPKNKDGTAIIKHDEYYKGVYALGIHAPTNPKYKHMALRQIKPMKYWRDDNKDRKRDYSGRIWQGLFYTNFHSTPESWPYNPAIRFNSIGCIWAPDNKEFHRKFIPMLQKSAELWGNSFSLAVFYEGTLS